MGDKFIVSDSGTGHLNFGSSKPGGPSGSGVYGEGVSGVPGTYPSYGQVPRQRVVNPVVERQVVTQYSGDSQGNVFVPVTDAEGNAIEGFDAQGRRSYALDPDPTSEQVLRPVYDSKGRPVYVSDSNQYRQPDDSFYAYIEAQIVARNAKTLAQPIAGSGGQMATVRRVRIMLSTLMDENGDTSYTLRKRWPVELNVDKIDDNGFVTMNEFRYQFCSATRLHPIRCADLQLNKRFAVWSDSLRDGQTLILTGVVSEQQIEEVKK